MAESVDFCPPEDELRLEVCEGLSATPKRLPCKLFYDACGSRLFEEITRLPEYYLTRTEISILRQCAGEIGASLGEECVLVEFGSGNSEKTRILLDALPTIAAYVPVDISRDHLLQSAARLRRDYPQVRVLPAVADFMRSFPLPQMPPLAGAISAFFPGSTFGNLDRREGLAFLKGVRWLVGDDGGLLIGLDLKKDPRVIERAYNDSRGVTAEFNKNVLLVANRLLDAEFNPALFEHQAIYDESEGHIEMRLISRTPQSVRVGDGHLLFTKGEYIVTEHSRKFDLGEFEHMAKEADFAVQRVWRDPAGYFAVLYLRASAGAK